MPGDPKRESPLQARGGWQANGEGLRASTSSPGHRLTKKGESRIILLGSSSFLPSFLPISEHWSTYIQDGSPLHKTLSCIKAHNRQEKNVFLNRPNTRLGAGSAWRSLPKLPSGRDTHRTQVPAPSPQHFFLNILLSSHLYDLVPFLTVLAGGHWWKLIDHHWQK